MPTPQEWIERAKDMLGALGPASLAEQGIIFPREEYFPVVSYPPITIYPPARAEDLFRYESDPPPIPYSAYVHIPFCAKRCAFCHWVFSVNTPESEVDDYLDTLAMEMRLVRERLGMERIPVTTALFGGGTPTYLTPRQMEKVLNDFTEHFDLRGCRQFSFEAEPASLLGEDGARRLKILKDYGVHRISLGVQSFHDEVLKRMGRPHNADQAEEAIRRIHEAGIGTVSIDLIYGYPGLSVENWIASMERALASGADAWHLYRLRIQRYGDRQGAILKMHDQDPIPFPEQDTIYLMKALGQVISEEAGFNQHFSRIFARDRKHITKFMMDFCCKLNNVVGLGPSGWSNFHRTFTQNTGDQGEYRRRVREGDIPVNRGLFRDRETEARRSLITPLKNDRVFKDSFQKRIGVSVEEHFGEELARLKGFGLIEEDANTVSLSPRGRFFADETVTQLFQKKYLPFPELAHPLMPE